MLTSKERVLKAVRHAAPDRLPIKHEGREEVNQALMARLGIAGENALLGALGDDFRHVRPIYGGPELHKFPDGRWEGPWGEIWHKVAFADGKAYNETVYLPFADVTDLADLRRFRFPTADWYDLSTIREQCLAVRDHAVTFGDPAHIELINGVARIRGVEQVLVDLATEDPVYLALADARFRLYYEMTERALVAAGGMIDVVHCGQDLGSQNGPLISPRTFERIFAPRLGEFFAMVHRHGALVMMHSCGSVRAFIARLIDLGLDILDVVQVTAEGMDIRSLRDDFGADICFAGSMCVQTVLPRGSLQDIEREVRLRQELFAGGGLIIGPTHQIQVDTPLESILAMYQYARNSR